MVLWRPRSSMICCLQAGHPGEPMVGFRVWPESRGWEPGNQWSRSQPWAAEDRCLSSCRQTGSKNREFFFFCAFFCSGARCTGWRPPALGRAVCSPESTHSNANLLWKHPHRHTSKSCLIWAPRGPVRSAHKVNHTRGLYGSWKESLPECAFKVFTLGHVTLKAVLGFSSHI